MNKVRVLSVKESPVLFYRECKIGGQEYLITLRYSTDGKFISDDSILELWLDKLSEPSWVDPSMVQKFALEVYDKRDNRFNSLGPVIITDTEEGIGEELLDSIFSQIEDILALDTCTGKNFEKECLEVLTRAGFKNHFVGGGCSIPIRL